MNSKEMTIVRGGTYAGERWITMYHCRKVEKIDPQKEYWEATGEWLSRSHCMISFIEGLIETGWNVIIYDYRRHPTQPRLTSPHVSRARGGEPFIPEYKMFGVLWGTGLWNVFKERNRKAIVQPGTIAR